MAAALAEEQRAAEAALKSRADQARQPVLSVRIPLKTSNAQRHGGISAMIVANGSLSCFSRA